MKRSLVVGVDDTDDSQNALVQATDLARGAELSVVVVHVRRIPPLAGMSSMSLGPPARNLEVLEASTRQASVDVLCGAGLEWGFVVRSGDPAQELMAEAEERSASAIVVGGRPHRAAVSGVLGSIDAALVHRFHGSVLVVSGGDSEWHHSPASPLSADQAIDAKFGERLPR
jgi:nucleotide-binding universal stress UspA family protein